jgi:hypothetical protein
MQSGHSSIAAISLKAKEKRLLTEGDAETATCESWRRSRPRRYPNAPPTKRTKCFSLERWAAGLSVPRRPAHKPAPELNPQGSDFTEGFALTSCCPVQRARETERTARPASGSTRVPDSISLGQCRCTSTFGSEACYDAVSAAIRAQPAHRAAGRSIVRSYPTRVPHRRFPFP